MVLEKFKNFLKKDKDKREKSKFSTKDNRRSPPKVSKSKEVAGRKNRKPLDKNSPRREKNNRKEDLSLPSQKKAADLPDIPDTSPRSEGKSNRKGKGLKNTSPNRSPSNTMERNSRNMGRNNRRDSPRGNKQNETISQSEALQKIIERLDSIDRKLDELQRRR